MSDMFDIPNAKRVRRDDLYGSSSDTASQSQASDAEDDAEVRAKLNARLSSLLGLDLASTAVRASQEPPDTDPMAFAEAQRDGDGAEPQAERQEDEFEFRLFSTSSKTAAPVKVVLAESDDEDAHLGDGAFIVPARPTSYYLAGEPTLEQVERCRQTALAGDDILLGARKRAWGLERPWRVVRLGASGKPLAAAVATHKASRVKTTATLPSSAPADEIEKRKRPGKKRRIATRSKAKAEKEKREAAESQRLTKEEHLKEKKKRLNREKKLKRRAKEREQKLAGKGQEGSQPAASEPADSGSDDGSVA